MQNKQAENELLAIENQLLAFENEKVVLD